MWAWLASWVDHAAKGNLQYLHRFPLLLLAHLSISQSSSGSASSIEEAATAMLTVSHRNNRIYWLTILGLNVALLVSLESLKYFEECIL